MSCEKDKKEWNLGDGLPNVCKSILRKLNAAGWRLENLQALCAPCHLRYDAKHHAETRRNRKKIGAKEYADYGRCLMEGMKAGLQSEE